MVWPRPMAGGPVTVLFTDLVSSTELLQRVGDEQAQRVFRAHHRLLGDAVTGHGGHEVKWLGDGRAQSDAGTRRRSRGSRRAARVSVLPGSGKVPSRLCAG